MVYVQPSIYPGKWDAQNSLGFWDTNGSPNLGQTTRLYNHQQKKKKKEKKKRICRIVNFAVPTDQRVKLKESEKKDKYLDLARELKTVEHERDDYTKCNWCSWYSHQMIDTRTGDHEWRPSKLLHYWDRSEYWKESKRLEEICCYSNSSEKPSANADV